MRRRSILVLGGVGAAVGSASFFLETDRAQAKKASQRSSVVVELFTSQGCSSCPPADRQLRLLAERARSSGQSIIPLSFHVDYWNDLGWRDPFSSRQMSERQRSYARTWGTSRIYTPQMIVQGRSEFVGSHGRALETALREESKRKPDAFVSIAATERDGGVEVDLALQGKRSGTDLFVALVQDRATSQVTRGENAGRTLEHVNVVRLLKKLSTRERAVRLGLPSGVSATDCFVAAWVQRRSDAAILGAAQTRI